MIDTPHITTTPAQLTAYIPLRVPAAQIMQFMGLGINELMSTVAAQGVEVAGPWFSHHLQRPGEFFDFQISVPVKSNVMPQGRVVPGRLPATRVARTVYRGGYEGLGAGWGEFVAWITATGHQRSVNLWECYLRGPEAGPDASRYETELNQPLLG